MPQTELENCCEGIIDIFHRYSVRKDHHEGLSKAEFTKMLKEQLPNCIKGDRASGDGNRLFKELDKNKDGQLSFKEFMNFFIEFMTTSHDKFHHDH